MSGSAKFVSLVRERAEQSEAFPGIVRIGDRLARGMAAVFGHDCTVVPEALTVATVNDWRSAQTSGTLLARIKLHPLNGAVTFAVPLALMMQLVDLHYGGTGDVTETRDTASAAEDLLFSRLAEQFKSLIAPAWIDILPLAPELMPIGGPAPLGADASQIAVQPFSVRVGARLHQAACLYPLPLLRAVPQLLNSTELSEDDENHADPLWQGRLANAVMNVRLPVRTIFARPELPLSQLMSLMPGDIIPICLPNHLPVTVSGRHFAHGTVGETGGRAAIKIDRIEEGFAA
jgi:flagellar motor switch protein FliM